MLNNLVTATHPHARTMKSEHLTMQPSSPSADCSPVAVAVYPWESPIYLSLSLDPGGTTSPPTPLYIQCPCPGSPSPLVQSWHPLLTSFSFAVHLICISLCFPRFVSSLAFCAFLIFPADMKRQNRLPSSTDILNFSPSNCRHYVIAMCEIRAKGVMTAKNLG